MLTNGISNTIDGKPFFQGATRSIAFSIRTFGVSAGIGDAAKAIVEKGLLKALEVFVFQAMAHGFAGGLISAMQGGNNNRGYNKFGRVVDVYNLIGPCGNNCTTITYKALNFGGAKVSPAQTPVGMLFDFRLQSYINKGYKQNERLWGPK